MSQDPWVTLGEKVLNEVLKRRPYFRDTLHPCSLGEASLTYRWLPAGYYMRLADGIPDPRLYLICSGNEPIAWVERNGSWCVPNLVTRGDDTMRVIQAIL